MEQVGLQRLVYKRRTFKGPGTSPRSFTCDLRALCRKYDRCFGCGMHVPAATIADHKAKCPKDTARLKQRMGIVRKMDARGASKEEVNTFKTRAA